MCNQRVFDWWTVWSGPRKYFIGQSRSGVADLGRIPVGLFSVGFPNDL